MSNDIIVIVVSILVSMVIVLLSIAVEGTIFEHKESNAEILRRRLLGLDEKSEKKKQHQ
ncbi:MAG: hypothetical protein LBR74_05675 [Eubacterium sp.]|jgi:hypothetical protein|nr:hypothetical protein [Eubacterium sp.]